MDDEDEDGYDEVEEEEFVGSEGSFAPLVEHSVEEEDGAGRVECSSKKGKDKTGVFWECVGELEGGYNCEDLAIEGSKREFDLQMKGPPSAKNKYPGIYPSNGNLYANEKNTAPTASSKLPSIPHNLGPK